MNKEILDYTKPIVAWRAWKIFNFSLHALTASYEYPIAEPALGYTPGFYGSHGIHAFKRLDDLLNYLYRNNYCYQVIGQISLWGDIVEHELGYRAEYGYPKSLFMMPWTANLEIIKKSIRNTYGCEVYSGFLDLQKLDTESKYQLFSSKVGLI